MISATTVTTTTRAERVEPPSVLPGLVSLTLDPGADVSPSPSLSSASADVSICSVNSTGRTPDSPFF